MPHCHMKGKPIERTYLKVVFNTYFGMCYYYVCKTYIFLNLSYLKRKSKKKFFPYDLDPVLPDYSHCV